MCVNPWDLNKGVCWEPLQDLELEAEGSPVVCVVEQWLGEAGGDRKGMKIEQNMLFICMYERGVIQNSINFYIAT